MINNKKHKNIAIETMINFIEGRISASDFWIEHSKQGIFDLLINDVDRAEWQKKYNYPKYFFDRYNGENFFDRVELYNIVAMYLKRKKIIFNSFNKEVELSIIFSEMQPSWLDIQDENFLLSILNSAPKDVSQNKKMNYCKNKIKELFRYDIKPPKWLQNPEWPIINGKPLVFRKQITDNINNKIYYYFYDSDTDQEIVIEQFD